MILHDYNCVENFQDNNVYIPITVLEEVDKFKKGYEQINFNARAFTVPLMPSSIVQRGRQRNHISINDDNGVEINALGGRSISSPMACTTQG